MYLRSGTLYAEWCDVDAVTDLGNLSMTLTPLPFYPPQRCTEQYLKESGLNYTILRMCGFMQAVIGNYAVPVLEEQSVWGTSDKTKTAYLDAVDAAKMTLAALRSEETVGRTLTLAGPEAYSVNEVISMCEELSDSTANVTSVPVWLLKGSRRFLGAFQWAKDAADRLVRSPYPYHLPGTAYCTQ